MRRSLPAALAAVFSLAGCRAGEPPAPAELVLHNGKIFTATFDAPFAEAMLIRGERILAVGSNAEVQAAAGPDARSIDLGGRTVIPGINDAHDHVSPFLPQIEVATTPEPLPDPPFRLVADSLRAAVARSQPGATLVVRVGEQALSDPAARRAALDGIAADRSIMLQAWTGHGLVLNSRALQAIGIDDSMPDPLGGRMERDRDGRLTGLLEEYASYGIWSRLTPRTDSAVIAAFRARADEVVRLGITSIQNMTTAVEPANLAPVLDSLVLPIRLRLIRLPTTSARGRLLDQWRALRSPASGAVTVSGTKYILDGTPVERLAALKQPYSDRPGWRGRLNFPPDTVRAILAEALAAGDQPMIHAVGDSAIALVISTMSELGPDSVWRRLRVRIEHGEGLTPDLFERARALGMVVVQNPSHLALGPQAAARYGPARMKVLQPMKSLLSNAIMLGLGSDGPINPFLNIMLAAMHPDNPSEALTVEQAVRAYTLGSAYAEHEDMNKGRLAPAMLADLAVLSQDIFTVPLEQLAGTTSVLTLVGGKAVFDPEGLMTRAAAPKQ